MSQVQPEISARESSANGQSRNRSPIARSGQKLKEFIKDRDLFGESYRMKLDDGEEEVKSFMGSLCSLLLTVVICLYAY